MWEWLGSIVGFELLTLLFWVYVVYAFGAAVFIILDNRYPSSTFAWLSLFVLLPLIGVGIYILFGREMRPFSKRSRLARIGPEMESAIAPLLEPLIQRQDMALRRLRTEGEFSQIQGKLAGMLRRTNLAMLTIDNHVEMFQDAENTYPRMEADIRNARHSIHMEYFTWTVDKYTEGLADLLIERAQAGVHVRILYDALGSVGLDWLHRGYVRRLRQGGVEIYSYLNRFFLLSLHTINYRNHRKITVIDGEVAYTGGLNMGNEHLDGAGPYNAWRDTHLRIKGESVAVLQAVFATSWYNTRSEHLDDKQYFAAAEGTRAAATRRPADTANDAEAPDAIAPDAIAADAIDDRDGAHEAVETEALPALPVSTAQKTVTEAQHAATTSTRAAHNASVTPVDAGIPGDGVDPPRRGYAGVPVQIVGSGPDSQWYAIQQLYFFMIPLANKHVYIQSPFFVPDPSVGEALKAAALAGVDVRIMCARRDTASPFPNWAANTYFDDMARAGVKIYLMQSAYLHAKTISIDSAICSVGTANMDLRSFQINYEINAVLYHRELARELEDQFHRDLDDCVQFDRARYRRRSNYAGRLRDSLARLISPLL